MSYQGGPPPGPGYSHGYGPPGSYQTSGNQQLYQQNMQPRTSWNGSSQGIGMQQPEQRQQMIQMQPMQQMHPAQMQNQTAYYRQQNYAPVSDYPVPGNYAQTPVQHQYQFSQYAGQQYQQPVQQQQTFQRQHPVEQHQHFTQPQQPVLSQQPAQQQHPAPEQQHVQRKYPVQYQHPIQHQQQVPPLQSVQQRQYIKQEQPVQYHQSPTQPHGSIQQKSQAAVVAQKKSQQPNPATSESDVKVQIPRNHEQIKIQPLAQPESGPESQPIDKSMLLIALAEEYFAAAQKIGPSVVRTTSEELMEDYQSIMATGLGCLEAAFKKTRLPPRLEAKVRLRYASVLYEETENYMEAETALSQGIILCEQNRYLDLKYSMQALLAQVLFMKNPRASLKSLERCCADSEAYRHHAWEYVFRFLRASLALKSNKVTDVQIALHELRHISIVANDRGDHAIYLLSSLMEVVAHLSQPNSESVEQVQTALAAAWTYQLEADGRISQLLVLRHILDLTCSLLYGPPTQTELKQKSLEDAFKSSAWSTSTGLSGSFALPINNAKAKGQAQLVNADTRKILDILDDGRVALVVSFLDNNDTFAMIRLLSGIALFNNNCLDGKAAQHLEQGLRSVQDSNKSRKKTGPLPEIVARSQWREVISCYLLVYTIFCDASSSDWKAAMDHLELLQEAMEGLQEVSKGPLTHLQIYLSGICAQGTGDLDEALRKFGDPKLHLTGKSRLGSYPVEQLQQELALLASLSILWIQQADSRHDATQNSLEISRLEPFCAHHPNKDIETAFNLIKATVVTDPPTPGFQTKNCLSKALEGAKSTSNKQFLCITLSVMCSKFFVGITGNQADKAGKASAYQARRARSTLWQSVTEGMLAQNLELQGKPEEAQAVEREARHLAALAFPKLS